MPRVQRQPSLPHVTYRSCMRPFSISCPSTQPSRSSTHPIGIAGLRLQWREIKDLTVSYQGNRFRSVRSKRSSPVPCTRLLQVDPFHFGRVSLLHHFI